MLFENETQFLCNHAVLFYGLSSDIMFYLVTKDKKILSTTSGIINFHLQIVVIPSILYEIHVNEVLSMCILPRKCRFNHYDSCKFPQPFTYKYNTFTD